jgi:hypothetical protein
MQAQQKAVTLRDTPAKGFTQALLGSLHARIGQAGELGGSFSPAISASIIFLPLAPMISVIPT